MTAFVWLSMEFRLKYFNTSGRMHFWTHIHKEWSEFDSVLETKNSLKQCPLVVRWKCCVRLFGKSCRGSFLFVQFQSQTYNSITGWNSCTSLQQFSIVLQNHVYFHVQTKLFITLTTAIVLDFDVSDMSRYLWITELITWELLLFSGEFSLIMSTERR